MTVQLEALYVIELFNAICIRSVADTTQIVAGEGIGAATRFRSQKTAGLLAYLAYHCHRLHKREVLTDMFWPDAPTSTAARISFNQSVANLRFLLEPPGVARGSVLITDPLHIGLDPQTITTDAARFDLLMDRAEHGTKGIEAKLEAFKTAVAFYKGALCPGHYEDWIVPERERLTARWIEAMVHCARLAEQSGDLISAVAYARKAIHASGNICEAGQTILQRIQDRQMIPSSRTAASLTSQNMNFGVARRPSGTPSSEHQFPHKSCNHSLSHEYDERPLYAGMTLPPNRFFGRTEEMARLLQWIADPDYRLLTIAGAGGCGKTRLARETLTALQKQSTVVSVVAADLTSLEAPERLAETIAVALGAQGAATASSERAYLDAICDRLALHEHPVLLLDNIEQLVPDVCPWIEDLVVNVPNLTVVVTSRVVLDIEGEAVFLVGPLPVPPSLGNLPLTNTDIETLLTRWPSLALFAERAERSRLGFHLTPANVVDVVRIVQLLEGIPLSIELAAARCRMFPPQALLQHLPEQRLDLLNRRGRSSGDRHRSLRETIAWSFNLLPESLQKSFARLSVFRGGWSYEAAAKVIQSDSPLEDLGLLCDASLIQADPVEAAAATSAWRDHTTVRFRMLETLRVYGAENLARKPEEERATLRLHAKYFESVAAAAIPALLSGGQVEAVRALILDDDNLMAAVRRVSGLVEGPPSADIFTPQQALSMSTSLFHYWKIRGYATFGRTIFSFLLKAKRWSDLQQFDGVVLCRAFTAWGSLSFVQSDYREARGRYKQALRLASRYDPNNRRRIAGLWNNLGTVAVAENRIDEAFRRCNASLTIWREVGDSQFIARNLANLGELSSRLQRFEQAEEQLLEAVDLAVSTGDKSSASLSRLSLSEVYFRTNRLARAVSVCIQALRDSAELQFSQGCALALLNLAIFSQFRGEARASEWLYQAGRSALLSAGSQLPEFIQAEARRLGLDTIDPLAETPVLSDAVRYALTLFEPFDSSVTWQPSQIHQN